MYVNLLTRVLCFISPAAVRLRQHSAAMYNNSFFVLQLYINVQPYNIIIAYMWSRTRVDITSSIINTNKWVIKMFCLRDGVNVL